LAAMIGAIVVAKKEHLVLPKPKENSANPKNESAQ
jgi:hypothetical protein